MTSTTNAPSCAHPWADELLAAFCRELLEGGGIDDGMDAIREVVERAEGS